MKGTKIINKEHFNWCEHCGDGCNEMVGQFISIEQENGGVLYCPCCALNNGDLNLKEYKKILKENKEVYIAWLKKELELQLTNQDRATIVANSWTR